jgi:hypothetical protein
MAKNDTRKLTCTACKYENEVERVYCHNCGEKLDRSLLPALDDLKTSEESAKAGKKVKRMMNPNKFAWVRTLKTFVLIEVFAAVVAAGFLALQAPENVPPYGKDHPADLEAAFKVSDNWTGMMSTRPTVHLMFKESDLNHYLLRNVKSSEGPLGIKFKRSFVLLEPGLVTVATHRDAWGMPIYNGVTFKPAMSGVKWTADIQRLSIGRLTIPAAIGKLLKLDALITDPLSKVFEKEIKQLDRLDKIDPGANVISFVTKPAQ